MLCLQSEGDLPLIYDSYKVNTFAPNHLGLQDDNAHLVKTAKNVVWLTCGRPSRGVEPPSPSSNTHSGDPSDSARG